jgi:hypothetical protein
MEQVIKIQVSILKDYKTAVIAVRRVASNIVAHLHQRLEILLKVIRMSQLLL